MVCESNNRFGQAQKAKQRLNQEECKTRAIEGEHRETKRKLADSQLQLGKQQEETQRENREVERRLECKICMQNACDIVLLPCHHMCCCKSCYSKLKESLGDQLVACPNCRQPVNFYTNVIVS